MLMLSRYFYVYLSLTKIINTALYIYTWRYKIRLFLREHCCCCKSTFTGIGQNNEKEENHIIVEMKSWKNIPSLTLLWLWKYFYRLFVPLWRENGWKSFSARTLLLQLKYVYKYLSNTNTIKLRYNGGKWQKELCCQIQLLLQKYLKEIFLNNENDKNFVVLGGRDYNFVIQDPGWFLISKILNSEN